MQSTLSMQSLFFGVWMNALLDHRWMFSCTTHARAQAKHLCCTEPQYLRMWTHARDRCSLHGYTLRLCWSLCAQQPWVRIMMRVTHARIAKSCRSAFMKEIEGGMQFVTHGCVQIMVSPFICIRQRQRCCVIFAILDAKINGGICNSPGALAVWSQYRLEARCSVLLSVWLVRADDCTYTQTQALGAVFHLLACVSSARRCLHIYTNTGFSCGVSYSGVSDKRTRMFAHIHKYRL
jgi:hypothetical protein